MLLKVFCVYDSKIGAYLPPLFLRSKGEAVRAFSAASNSADHDFHRYAEDYTLFEIGEWDDSTAQFSCFATPVSVGKAIEFIKFADKSAPLDVLGAAVGH